MKLIFKNNWCCYKNGPFTPLHQFILNTINPFNWKNISWRWVKWSIKNNLPHKFKYPKQEFDYFMNKYKTRTEWFKEYKYKKF